MGQVYAVSHPLHPSACGSQRLGHVCLCLRGNRTKVHGGGGVWWMQAGMRGILVSEVSFGRRMGVLDALLVPFLRMKVGP